MTTAERSNRLKKIPRAQEVRNQLGVAMREVDILRRLLRVAEAAEDERKVQHQQGAEQ